VKNQTKNPQKLISIIVPVYNTAQYLPRCIESLTNQTHPHLEIILINDGSTDTGAEICNDYAKKDNRIKVIHQENAGVSNARNTGINAATGEWIGFTDSDDWAEPDMFESLLNTALKNKTTISACGFIKHCPGGLTETRTFEGTPEVIPEKDTLNYVLDGKYFDGFLWNKLFKASLIKDNNLQFTPKLHTCQDLVFVVEAIVNGGTISCISNPLYHYCIRKGSKTQSFNKKRLTELESRAIVITRAESISPKCAAPAKCSYTAAAVNLIRDAVDCGAFQYLPKLKKEALRYICRFIFSRNYDFRLKLRAVIIIFFPKTALKVWAFVKRKFNITWWHKELKNQPRTKINH
jgi:glycosyltransferase involved in cell wall biosynthesis